MCLQFTMTAESDSMLVVGYNMVTQNIKFVLNQMIAFDFAVIAVQLQQHIRALLGY